MQILREFRSDILKILEKALNSMLSNLLSSEIFNCSDSRQYKAVEIQNVFINETIRLSLALEILPYIALKDL